MPRRGAWVFSYGSPGGLLLELGLSRGRKPVVILYHPPPASAPLPQFAQASRGTPTGNRVLVISIDGGRPDLLLRAGMPNLRRLMREGSYSMWAKTTAQAVTLPLHMSMLTGVSPNVHQIFWNTDLPLEETVCPKAATLFEVAKKAGYSTALVAGKSKFAHLNKPGAVDHPWITTNDATDDATDNASVTREAVRILKNNKPGVMFVHFPETDNVGHALGWGTDEQIACFERTDADIGELFRAMEETGVAGSTFIILSAHHGGQGRVHGPDDVRSRTIPWIIRGPGVRANCDFTRVVSLEIRTEDTFATACEVLKIPAGKVEGKPVTAAMKEGELLK